MLGEAKLSFIKDRSKFLCNCFLRKALSNTESIVKENIIRHHKILRKKKSNGKLKIINQCVLNLFEENNKHYLSYNINSYSYETLTTVIPVNLETGHEAKKCREPNLLIDQLICERNAVAIFTDGSKSLIQYRLVQLLFAPNVKLK